MQNVYTDTRELDRAAVRCFGLTEDILMENAACALEKEVVCALQICAASTEADKKICAGGGAHSLPNSANARAVALDGASHKYCAASKALPPDTSVREYRTLIVCGSGDNGGDGWALARRLNGGIVAGIRCSVTVLEAAPPKSQACVRQAERARAAGVKVIRSFSGADFAALYQLIVDCLFGSGFHGTLKTQAEKLIGALNKADCFKIACDIPSGIDLNGSGTKAFCADVTVCMGAFKTALFSDFAKNHTGRIVSAQLGIPARLFESGAAADAAKTKLANGAVPAKDGLLLKSAMPTKGADTAESDEPVEPAAFLLEASDMALPERSLPSVHKGDFGHAAVYTGEKPGAGIIAACAAFRCGAGLVSVIAPAGQMLYGVCGERGLHTQKTSAATASRSAKKSGTAFPYYLMQSADLPEKASAVAAGMGFGRKDEQHTASRAAELFSLLNKKKNLPCVLDADLFYRAETVHLLKVRPTGLVLTPHPKEFCSLLSLCGLANVSVEEVVKNRLDLVRKFCAAYPGAVLLLKGANMTIGFCPKKESAKHFQSVKPALYINTFGMPCLAKGGSGDVLAGLVCAFLAQKYKPLDAALQASLLLSAASRLQKSSYSSTPFTLIESLENAEKLRAVLSEK